MHPKIMKIIKDEKKIQKQQAELCASSPLLETNKEPQNKLEVNCTWKFLSLFAFFCSCTQKKSKPQQPNYNSLPSQPADSKNKSSLHK